MDGLDAPWVRQLYSVMQRVRVVEEYLAQIYAQQEMRCPMHLCIGQEAVAAGACAHLLAEDVVFTSHRSHGWYLAKGGDLNRLVAELYGRATGCSGGWGGSPHLVDTQAGVMGSSAIVGGSVAHAVGAALAFKLAATHRVAAVGFGDSPIETGVFHESLNFAALKRLPVVFVCENNLYATQAPLAVRQPAVPIYARMASYGIPGVLVDGNDVLAVYAAARDAVSRARAGQGPTLLECRTYRWREHVGPNFDYDLGYRTKAELDEWMSRCPLKKLEAAGAVSRVETEVLQAQFRREVEQAVELARQAPFPTLALTR